MTKHWICPICSKKVIDSAKAKQQHLLDEMKKAQDHEMHWFETGMEARRLFRELFKTEP